MCKIGIAGYCIFLLCSVSGAAPGRDVPTIKNFAKFEEFAEKVMQIGLQSISVEKEHDPIGTIRVTVNKGMGNEECDFTLTEKEGVVLSASRWIKSAKARTLKASDAISKERAFEAVGCVLEYYNLRFQAEEFSAYLFNGTSDIKPDDHLEHCNWMWDKSPLYWNNVPCRGTRLHVSVDAASGIVSSVRYNPVVAPSGPEPAQDIGPAGAIERAKEWLKRSIPYFAGKNPRLQPDVGKQVKKVLALPFSMWESDPRAPMPCLEESFYCWEVPFVYTEHDHVFDGVIWINMSTGAFVGSGDVR